MECYFQASPDVWTSLEMFELIQTSLEMFEWVQDWALAWGLKVQKSWTEDNVFLNGGPSAHKMLSILKKLL